MQPLEDMVKLKSPSEFGGISTWISTFSYTTFENLLDPILRVDFL